MADGFEQRVDAFVVVFDLALQLRQLMGQFLVQGERLPQAHKGAHDGDVDLDGALAVQHAGEHGDALLGERGDWFRPATMG